MFRCSTIALEATNYQRIASFPGKDDLSSKRFDSRSNSLWKCGQVSYGISLAAACNVSSTKAHLFPRDITFTGTHLCIASDILRTELWCGWWVLLGCSCQNAHRDPAQHSPFPKESARNLPGLVVVDKKRSDSKLLNQLIFTKIVVSVLLSYIQVKAVSKLKAISTKGSKSLNGYLMRGGVI